MCTVVRSCNCATLTPAPSLSHRSSQCARWYRACFFSALPAVQAPAEARVVRFGRAVLIVDTAAGVRDRDLHGLWRQRRAAHAWTRQTRGAGVRDRGPTCTGCGDSHS